MNKKEIDDILNILFMNYNNLNIEEISKVWSEELSQYNYSDVKNRLDELMSREEYHLKAPFLVTITKGLTKASDKINFNELVYYCHFCRRAFNDYEQMIDHENRCRSIKYIERQYKRFNFGTVDKKELYNLSQEEFDKRYKKLLKIVLEKSTKENEKQIIKNIFNPPNEQQARTFLKTQHE